MEVANYIFTYAFNNLKTKIKESGLATAPTPLMILNLIFITL